MPVNILMPALSPTMTEGNLAKWLKNEGDAVKSGDIICEIETDKATMEFEAADEGVLGKILVPGGTSGVKVNQPIAVLLLDGEDASAVSAAPAAAPTAAPAAAVATVPAAIPSAAPAVSAPAASSGDRVFASPLAKRIAKDGNLDLGAVKGSGPHGRIVKADVEAALAAGPAPAKAAAPAAGPAAAKPAPVPAAASPFEPAFEEIPNTSMRKIIARRLTEAKSTIPHFYLSIDCELDALLKVRSDLNGRSDAYKLSVNDFVVRAVALALKKVPAANASWGEEAIKRYKDV